MMKIISITILLLSGISLFAQDKPSVDLEKQITILDNRLKDLQTLNENLQAGNARLKSGLEAIRLNAAGITDSLRNLKAQVQGNTQSIQQTGRALGTQIQQTGRTNDTKITAVSKLLSRNTLYWIIAFLSAILLSAVTYLLIIQRQNSDRTHILEQLSQTRSYMEESLRKQTGLIREIQMQSSAEQKNINKSLSDFHSLLLKVSDGMTLIEKNVNLLDAKTKDLKQMAEAVNELTNKLAAKSSEVPDLQDIPLKVKESKLK